MTILNENDLRYVLIDSLRGYDDGVVLRNWQNPYRLGFQDFSAVIHISNVHFADRDNPDEYRIQCPGNLPALLKARRKKGDNIIVVGYYKDVDVFSAWDPNEILNRSTKSRRFSLYTRKHILKQASTNGYALYVDDNFQKVLAFRPSLLGLYVHNSSNIHNLSAKGIKRLISLYDSALSGKKPIKEKIEKKKVNITVTQYPRDPKFREMVLEAYGYRCAVCGIQLDLVEAAHIIPHAHSSGTDALSNGLALCPLHHKSFDTGLLIIDDLYQVTPNSSRISYLKKIGKDKGAASFAKNLLPNLLLPNKKQQYPSKTKILQGNDLRGITV